MGFTKLDEGIVFSSIMGEDDSVFRVWIVLLATCKSDGVAPISEVFLSTITRKPLSEIKRCIKVLESPDENSRIVDNDGIRIQRVDGGFEVLNYQKYREESKNDYLREKQQKFRDKQARCIDTVSIPSASASTSSSVLDVFKKEVNELTEFSEIMRNAFVAYWTEPTPSGKKVRFQLQKTWSTKLRLLTWASREKISGSKKRFGRNEVSNEDLIAQAQRIDLSNGTEQIPWLNQSSK